MPVKDVFALLGWHDNGRRARRRGRPAAKAEATALIALCIPLVARTAPREHLLSRAAPRHLRPRPQPCAHIEVVR